MAETKYKQTEVKWKSLGEATTIKRGVRVVRKQLKKGIYPVYQNSLIPLGYYDNYNCLADTTFIICGGAAGEIGYSDVCFWAADDCFYIVCPKTIWNKYIYYFLLSKYNFINSFVRKASIPRLAHKDISNLLIPLPPLTEQRAIASALTSIDDLIASLDKQIAKTQSVKQGAIQQFLTNLSDGKVVYSTIGDVCEISRGVVISKDYIRRNLGEYPVYSSQTENKGVLGKISTYMYDGEFLTWTTDGENAGSVFYRNGRFNITNVCGLLKVRNINTLSARYLSYILNKAAKSYVNRDVGNPKLMSNIMATVEIPIPPIEIQLRIASILTSIDDQISALEAKRKKYEMVKVGMMQQLLMGKIRLK